MQPTSPGAPSPADSALTAEPITPAAGLSLPPNFPVQLSPSESAEIEAQLEQMDLARLPLRDIALLGGAAEAGLHRTLGAILARIERSEQPRIFKLVTQLRDAVEREDLPALADRILNARPGLMDRVAGFFSQKALAQAAERRFEEVHRVAAGKVKRLADVITTIEHELRSEQTRLDSEIRALDALKARYRSRFVEFAQLVAFMRGFLEKSRAHLAPVDPPMAPELHDKLQALESRALAIEGTLTRLPPEPLVTRQLQDAGISILRETHASASSRVAYIKKVLMTTDGALAMEAAQRPVQAQKLKVAVDATRELVDAVEQVRHKRAEQFEQARGLFTQARAEMTLLGQPARPEPRARP